jgi:ribosome-binding protein aMBF1 (putative translation factor)
MKEWQIRGGASNYMDPYSLDCKVCGKTIPTRAWIVVLHGEELVFCDPDCERLYHDYWLPKYGSKTGVKE